MSRSPNQIATSEGLKRYWRNKKRAQPEQQLHKAVADYLRLALRPPTIWTTIGHGGGGKARGGQLKAMGMHPGWPDILVMARFPTGMVLVGLELKTKVGRQSPEQRAMEQKFKDCAAWYILCRSVEEVEKALRFCKVELHATVSPSREGR
jgi:hypothetical protein